MYGFLVHWPVEFFHSFPPYIIFTSSITYSGWQKLLHIFFTKKKKGWTIWGSLINPIMSVLAFKKHWPGEIKKFLLFSRCFGNWRIRTTLVTLPLPQVFPPTEVQLAQWHPKDYVKKESVKLNLWLLYVAEQWWSLRQTAVLARISSAIYLVLTEEERSSATLN